MKQLEMLYEGKAKQIYMTDDADRVVIRYTDAATAFNNVKKATIANKGVYNNRISAFIFGYLRDAGIENHYIAMLDDRDQLCRRVEIIPIEVIVRNVVAGSMAKRLGLEEGTRPSNVIYDICYKADELEISPDTCRLWDMKTGEKLDKDRFRRDLGHVIEAYEEIYSRLESLKAE